MIFFASQSTFICDTSYVRIRIADLSSFELQNHTNMGGAPGDAATEGRKLIDRRPSLSERRDLRMHAGDQSAQLRGIHKSF